MKPTVLEPGLNLLWASVGLTFLSGVLLPAAAAELTAGISVVDITPPAGYRMSGYFYERLSTGIHDPLQAKALVLEQGRERVALVFCDLIGMAPEVTAQARRAASERTAIPTANILIAATHSHTGPEYFGSLREYFHNRALARDGRDSFEGVNYPEILADRLADAILQAAQAVKPVHLAVGKAQPPGLSFNRRFQMKNGTVVFNPGKLNPDIVRTAGPIDPDLGILLVREARTDKPLASFASFALHLDTTGGAEYSADYPFYLERGLRKKFGPDFVSIFGTGTCGDINHIDVTTQRPQKGGEEAVRIGTTLAGTVIESLPQLRTMPRPALAARRAAVLVPLQQFTPQQIAEAREKMSGVGTAALPFLEQVRVCKIMDLQLRKGATALLEVQVFRLGPDTAIVGLPGEVFVELGLAIKQASPFENTFVVELSNDDIAYVPTRKAFAEGSYEIVNSRVQPGGGEMLVDAAVRLLRELKQ
ncbi:MAG: neutral/alkaline non-lysosomal ceramidase N-terminal domain-containing protein [Limisphaerales bacterium]